MENGSILYTCAFGRKHCPRQTSLPGICFTDQKKLDSKGWTLDNRLYRHLNYSPTLKAKMCKILSHTIIDADYSIYVDSTFRLKEDFPEFIEECLDSQADLVFVEHPERSSIYEEAEYCIEDGRGNAKSISAQVEHYNEKGFKSNYLLAGGIIFRRHNKVVESFNNAWMAEVIMWSTRDQLSLPYALNQFDGKLQADRYEVNLWNNQFWEII